MLNFQVYTLDQSKWNDLCLSGTAEMGIAYYLSNIKFNDKIFPLKIGAVSRCFRAETSKIAEEKGIYRYLQPFNVNQCFAHNIKPLF